MSTWSSFWDIWGQISRNAFGFISILFALHFKAKSSKIYVRRKMRIVMWNIRHMISWENLKLFIWERMEQEYMRSTKLTNDGWVKKNGNSCNNSILSLRTISSRSARVNSNFFRISSILVSETTIVLSQSKWFVESEAFREISCDVVGVVVFFSIFDLFK